MAITTTLQPKYILRIVIIAIISVILGLWGLWDYFYGIPAKQRGYDRWLVCNSVREALTAEVGTPEAKEKIEAAAPLIFAELEKLRELGMSEGDGGDVTPEQAIETIKARNEENWFAVLLLFGNSLNEAARRIPGSTPSPDFVMAFDIAEEGVTKTGEITKPAAYDPYVKGLGFAPCLPFGFYLFWPLMKKKKEIYSLDDDGSFHAGDETWAKEEIADVDLSRWMSKSIAFMVHTDGKRIKLDDYVFKNVHLIVGAIASEKYPEDWDDQAKPIKDEEPEEVEPLEPEEGDEVWDEGEDEVEAVEGGGDADELDDIEDAERS